MTTSSNHAAKANPDSLKARAAGAIPTLQSFLSKAQLAAMIEFATTGEEREYFLQTLVDLNALIQRMPVTYQQENQGSDAIVYLHYFLGPLDWYVTEKDIDGGVLQAFGYTLMHGDTSEGALGYICIEEITRMGAEIDLHWTPKRLGDVQNPRAGRYEWVLGPGTGPNNDGFVTWGEFHSYADAVRASTNPGFPPPVVVLKRLPDGTLTPDD